MAMLLVVTSSCFSLVATVCAQTPPPAPGASSSPVSKDTLHSAWEGADESGNGYMRLWLGQLPEPLRLDFPQNLCTHRSVPDPAGTP